MPMYSNGPRRFSITALEGAQDMRCRIVGRYLENYSMLDIKRFLTCADRGTSRTILLGLLLGHRGTRR